MPEATKPKKPKQMKLPVCEERPMKDSIKLKSGYTRRSTEFAMIIPIFT